MMPQLTQLYKRVPGYIDSGGNVNDLVVARNCYMARVGVGMNMSARGGQKVQSALSGPMDLILRYKNYLYLFYI